MVSTDVQLTTHHIMADFILLFGTHFMAHVAMNHATALL